MFVSIGDWYSQFRPRSALVRIAQIDLLFHHARFQTLAAPLLALFLLLAFAEDEKTWPAWVWFGCLCTAYAARIVAMFVSGERTDQDPERRLLIYLLGLSVAGFAWAFAPHALAMPGSDAQLIVGIFVGVAVLVGVVGNFLYYRSALIYTLTWIVPTLISLGFVYTAKFESIAWTYTGVVAMFLLYAYKCLEVINLPLGESLELNEALTEEKEKAQASDRAKSDFLAMMSHELRTPLNAVMGYSEIIRDQIFGPNANSRYVEQAARIREAAGLLSELIGDLLELSALQSRGRTLKIELVEPSAIVETAMSLLQDTAAKKRLNIQTEFGDTLPALPVDRRAAVQCLTNILGNAIKYSPEGSDIMVEVSQSDRFIRFRVIDNGPGIPDSEIERITQPFHRGSAAMATQAHGVGLGLSIAENLIKRHNGTLEVMQRPTKGTEVLLAFPVTAGIETELAPQPAADGEIGMRG